MTYVITQPCCGDASCAPVCPVDCIHPAPHEPGFGSAEMLYIDAKTCIDCGACVDVCPVDAIVPDTQLDDRNRLFLDLSARHFQNHEYAWRPHPTKPHLPRASPPTVPLRVAIVGSGPAAFYAASDLLGRVGPAVEVTMFEQLSTPGGLARFGVAPDHPRTRGHMGSFAAVVRDERFTLHLGVRIGRDISLAELRERHHAVIWAGGAAGDRAMGIPGEGLAGCHAATEFVAWYNGHPDALDHEFDLSHHRAVVVGNGNVALDAARLLLKTPAELADLPVAPRAREALSRSSIREVLVIGRRGPAQAAYTTPELMELGHLQGVVVTALQSETTLDPITETALRKQPDTTARLKAEMAQEYVGRSSVSADRTLVLRYLTSPLEVLGDRRVTGLRVVRNELVADTAGITARATQAIEDIDCGLVLRSVGYRGAAVEELPYDDRSGTIHNHGGRVTDQAGEPIGGVYTVGWIKRGPSGGIGSNKFCAERTVDLLIQDFAAGALPVPTQKADVVDLIGARSSTASLSVSAAEFVARLADR